MKVGLLTYSVVNDCCKLQRVEWPLSYLHKKGKIELMLGYLSMIPLLALNAERRKELLDAVDTLIIQRPQIVMSELELFLEMVEREKPDMSIIFEFDDWLWQDDELIRFSHLISKYPIICSTQVLANSILTVVPRAKIFVYNTKIALPNGYLTLLEYTDEISEEHYNSNMVLHTGTKTHMLDIAQITDALKDFFVQHGEAKMTFWGNNVPHQLEKYTNRLNKLDFVSDYTIFTEQFLNFRCRFGINPLAPTKKNWCKSAIKFIEYGLKGVPALFEDMPEYRRVMPADLDFLLTTSDTIGDKLEMLYTLPKHRLEEIGMRMQEVVFGDHVMTEDTIDMYFSIIEKCNDLNLRV